MAAKKPRVVIIGAGMAGITAANRLHTAAPGRFDLTVVEGGDRIGGRIRTTEFGGDRVELGATWIHGIGGSPVHAIASEIGALESDQPWECMDGASEDPTRFVTVAEGGLEVDRSLVEPVESLYKSLMCHAQGKPVEPVAGKIAEMAYSECLNLKENSDGLSVGSYLRKGLSLYWDSVEKNDNENGVVFVGGSSDEHWSRKMLEEGVFEVFENTQRTYTSAGDLTRLDYVAESEYVSCSAEEITIAKGYTSVVEHLASVLPTGLVKLGKRVSRIEWGITPVKLHFSDGTSMEADHVVVTVSLGVLKAGVREETIGGGGGGGGELFSPALPRFKIEAIERLGFGLVNKLFVKLSQNGVGDGGGFQFPFLRMVFRKGKEDKGETIPQWMRRTASMFPVYDGSRVLLSWFAGEEALELELIDDDGEVIEGVEKTISSFLGEGQSKRACNGNSNDGVVKVEGVLKSKWGSDPLFLGSYSYVEVGSSGDDLDSMAQPLPCTIVSDQQQQQPPLQILFAGEATHRTHYSTTHGAYFSGIREANRLLKHYHY